MTLVNCKVKLKFKWTKYCVFSAAGNDNDSDNDDYDNVNNIIFTFKDTKYVPVVTLLARDNETIKNYQNFLEKDLKD